MRFAYTIAALLFVLSPASSPAQQTLLLEQPAVSAEHLAFVYAGDIWLAARDGSNPRRLTSDPAEENHPVFSPDGKRIAFAAEYEGNADVHVIRVAGGQPQRLTWHPEDDIPTDWSADGKQVNFVSGRETDHGRSEQLFQVVLTGGAPRKLMEARVYRGVFNQAGDRLAYIPFASGYNGLFGGTAGWKGYRGGTTPAIMIMDTGSNTVVKVPGADATNFNPLWLGDQLYFLSDRDNKQFSVFHYDPASGAIRKVSSEAIWDIRAASGFGSTLVYSAGGRLKSLDTQSGTTQEIEISIKPDLEQLRTSWRDASKTIQAADISPTGKRVIITARGDVFTVPTDEGSTRNLSRSSTVREYSGSWSPAGDRVAWIEDGLRGQSLVIANQSGSGSRQSFALGPHFYEILAFVGGNSDRIVFADNHLSLHTIELSRGKITTIATGARREALDIAVSPDGAWLAYTQELPNHNRDLMLYNFASARHYPVSDSMADAAAPAFSRDGNYLFFAASTNSGPLQVGLNMTSQERPYRAGLYAAVLAADGRSPLLPGTGDESADDEEKDAKDKAGKGDESKGDDAEKITPTRIDTAGLPGRIVALQLAERNYDNLAVADDGKLYFVQRVQQGGSNEPPGSDEQSANELLRFDFEEREVESLLDGVNEFHLSANGKHLLLAKVDGSLAVAEIGDELKPEALALDGLQVRVNPREEWALIFDEVWRMEKEFFYDPAMHGLDWQAVYDRYRPLVEHLGRREDLNALMVEMIAEMQVGHNRVGGGDVYRGNGTSTGLLGANLEIHNGHYRIARIYTGENWNPFLRGPLATPGNRAEEGEYILAIDGRSIVAEDNIYEFLQGTDGKQVALRVGPRADGREARDIVVEPISRERELRLWHWVEHNRAAVDKASDGRIGYVYLPNTAGAGYTFFNRMFFAQVDKDALIIDERSNGGGQAANYITDVLSRKHLSGWKDRDGMVFATPSGAMHGPKLMMIDQDAGSGGDFLPYAFRELGIGKLLGTRTWGGLIGIAVNPETVDGGFLTVPFFRFYDTQHRWSVENEGVAPDIEVALDPIATNAGRDTQLEAAIAEVLRELRDFSDPVPDTAPAYPMQLGE